MQIDTISRKIRFRQHIGGSNDLDLEIKIRESDHEVEAWDYVWICNKNGKPLYWSPAIFLWPRTASAVSAAVTREYKPKPYKWYRTDTYMEVK